jgi:hypothetical protein
MLASLLPGLRELRAPLAAGYIWLLGLWLTLTAMPAQPDYSAGIYRQLTDLANWVGKPTVLVASAFVAYLIGVLSNFVVGFINRGAGPVSVNRILREAVVNKLSRRFLDDPAFQKEIVGYVLQLRNEHADRVLQQRMAFAWYMDTDHPDGLRRLPQFLDIPSEQILKNRALEDYTICWNLISVVVDTRQIIAAARRDLEYMAPRLIGKEDKIHGEYDRLMAEGTFRTGMFLPMCYLFGVLAWLASPWWAVGLILPLALLYLGAHSRGLASQHLASAIVAERIESPALENIATAHHVPFAAYEEVVVSVKQVSAAASARSTIISRRRS